MKIKIQLTKGYETVVSEEDYDYLNKFSWCAHERKQGRYVYACSKIDGKFIAMHQLLVGRNGDHINHDTLDNTRENLRVATNQENCRNQRKPIGNKSSRFKGVSFKRTRKGTPRWTAQIRIDYRLNHLGYFDTEIEAAKKYNEVAKQLFGEFAHLNDI